MKLLAFNPKNVSQSGERRYRVGAMVDEQIADLTPSILPMGLSAVEILRCYDLDTNFVEPATDAIDSGLLPLVDPDDVNCA